MATTQTASGWSVRPNDGSCFSLKEGRWLWRAWLGTRTLEGVEPTRKDAERTAELTKGELVAARLQDEDPGRFPEWASPARMRREKRRDQEEDEYQRGWR